VQFDSLLVFKDFPDLEKMKNKFKRLLKTKSVRTLLKTTIICPNNCSSADADFRTLSSMKIEH